MKLLSIILSLIILPQTFVIDSSKFAINLDRNVNTLTTNTSKTAVILKVENYYTSTPLKNATVCLIDDQKYYKTDENGCLEIAFEEGKAPKNCSILVYKKGFTDHIVFNLKVLNGLVRFAPTIKLKELSDNSPPYTISCDIPSDKEIEKLIAKYKK